MSGKVKIFHGDTGVEHYITDLKDGIEARRVLNLLGPGYLKFSDDDVVVPGDRLAAGDYRFFRDSTALAPAEQHDPSREIVSQLLQPPLVQLPGTDELEKLLFSPPSVKLPIHARVLCKIQDSTVAEHFQAAAPADLSSCISFAIDHPEMPAGPIHGVDKPCVAMPVDRAKLVVAAVNYYRFLVAFDRALPQ
ncbi:hypothetical protein COCSUDRAFT_62334 [Coccomyxa subellipsoidea C-169]|uniref:Uncharacterized protein n=1 Tax=Coccomyxa subellipsoidea (strain C-169) TaxID=574566 RepID=I0Z2Q5_COCSC|nr:hypothetical protein COCSUDRAFT_62334 [Coccomyxa subellipsoidea C-169]EIE24924.1 hypothetical protein COCSUDRAFT_62334 [Coccomyxa subellipsoidea C-169]|eukprot:XP_005649468.1 hypothetical protein COCSUDRAFT_62334 [Coccomyxa subellipsoidea C-169]